MEGARKLGILGGRTGLPFLGAEEHLARRVSESVRSDSVFSSMQLGYFECKFVDFQGLFT